MDGNPFSTNYPAAWGGQAPGAGAGGFDWASLLQNRAFLSLMSQIGAGIAPDNSAVQGVNQLNQQMIGSKSMAGLMQKYLSGQVPGGKIQIDELGFKLSGPTSALGDLSGPSPLFNAQQGSQLPGGSGTQWNQQNAPQIGRQTNPFVSSQPGELSYADLAGLTPQDVLQAMNGAGDILYKQGLIENQKAQLSAKQGIDPLDKLFPVPVPGIGQMSFRQWNALPTDTKAYAAYVYQSKMANPDDQIMSEREWKMRTNRDTQLDYLRGLMDEPELKNLAIELKKAGAINIGETVAKTKAVGKAKQELDVTSPTYIRDTINPLKKEARDWKKSLAPYESNWKSKGVKDPTERRRLAELSYTIDTITYDLRRAFGKGDLEPIIEEETDDIVWIVNGKVVQRLSQ